jgi:hypothetical protein
LTSLTGLLRILLESEPALGTVNVQRIQCIFERGRRIIRIETIMIQTISQLFTEMPRRSFHRIGHGSFQGIAGRRRKTSIDRIACSAVLFKSGKMKSMHVRSRVQKANSTADEKLEREIQESHL